MYYLYLFISSNGTELYSEWLLCLSAVSTREQPLKRAAKFAPASAVPAQPWKIGRIWGKKKKKLGFFLRMTALMGNSWQSVLLSVK